MSIAQLIILMSSTPNSPVPGVHSAAKAASASSDLSVLPVATTGQQDVSSLLDSLDSTRPDHRTSFDPVSFLNKHYATEGALSAQLDDLREGVAERMEHLDQRIATALQRQSETANRTRQRVQEAQTSVQELQSRIYQIQDKARSSEQAVLEITKDMKRLDTAKKHLQQTITTLKRLHMLVHAVEQLRQASVQKPFADYQTAAGVMEATQLLLGHFRAFTDKVQPMRVLAQQVEEYQEILQTGLKRGFRVAAFGAVRAKELEEGTTKNEKKPVSDSSMDDSHTSVTEEDIANNTADTTSVPPEVLRGGVQLIDALGKSSRTQFIHEFCQDQLSTYLKEFEPPSKEPKQQEKRVSSFKVVETPSEPLNSSCSLEHIEKRFTWFRDLMGKMNADFRDVFPNEWKVQATLASIFLQLTRDHILALLDGPRKDPNATNATILLKSLQKTILFEKDITAFLQKEFEVVFEGTEDVADGVEKTKPLVGVASAAFESYMDPYIRLEEQSMDEQLVEALEDRTVDTRGERPVFISSTNLFVYIKGSITRCTALTKGAAFFMLYEAFKDSLRKYAQILNGKLPSQTTTPNPVVRGISFGSKQDNQGTSSTSYKLPSGEEVTVCHVISTCEYCADTMEALEDLIRDTIDDQYKEKVDMIGDQEIFHDTTAKSIRVLVSGLTNRTEEALKTMASINWSTFSMVGEESMYVRTIHEEIHPVVITVRGLLPSSYFRSFCDKFAATFIATYQDNLIRLKSIAEPGTQQLLLDVYSLKTLFLKLPILEQAASPGKKSVSAGSTIAPAMYTKTVQKQFARIETLLKLVGTPNDLLVDNFKMQWANGGSAELILVMNLKGIKRNEQTALLEKFGVDPGSALKGVTAGLTSATIVSERVQALQDQGSNVAAKVNSDLSQMRQKVDDFRKSFR